MKRTEKRKAFAVTLVTFSVFLLLMEVVMRIVTNHAIFYDIEMTKYANRLKMTSENPRIGHVHRPNREATLMGVKVRINSDGLRDRDYPVEKGDAHRIIFLGDSLTLGWGVEQADTFENLLEQKLNAIRPTEVINFGTGNYNTEQEVNLFLDKGVKYRPDQVVLFYFINDAEVTPRKSRWEFLGRSRALTFYWSRTRGAMANLSESKSFKSYYADLYKDDQTGWLNAKKAFAEMARHCRENEVRFSVILLPELHNLRDYPLAAEHTKIMDFLAASGIDALDLVPFFSSVENSHDLWVARDDAHPNQAAHKQIAQFSFAHISGDSE